MTAYAFAYLLAQRWLPDGQVAYNGQDVGVALSIATVMTNADRKHGRSAPLRGHNADHLATATQAVTAWKRRVSCA